MSDIFYLNNSGHRWTVRPSERCIIVLDGIELGERAIDYYEAFGNFATATVRYKGKRYTGFLKAADGCDTPIEGDSRRFLHLDKCRV